mgnify:CR=1 FL=1
MIKLFDKIKVTHEDPLEGFEMFNNIGLTQANNIKIWQCIEEIGNKDRLRTSERYIILTYIYNNLEH